MPDPTRRELEPILKAKGGRHPCATPFLPTHVCITNLDGVDHRRLLRGLVH